MKTLHRPVLDGVREAMKNDSAPEVVEICTEIYTNLENMIRAMGFLKANCYESPERKGQII